MRPSCAASAWRSRRRSCTFNDWHTAIGTAAAAFHLRLGPAVPGHPQRADDAQHRLPGHHQSRRAAPRCCRQRAGIDARSGRARGRTHQSAAHRSHARRSDHHRQPDLRARDPDVRSTAWGWRVLLQHAPTRWSGSSMAWTTTSGIRAAIATCHAALRRRRSWRQGGPEAAVPAAPRARAERTRTAADRHRQPSGRRRRASIC